MSEENALEGYSAGKELFLPVVASSGATWGCQTEGDITGFERWLVRGMVYQTGARWNGLDEYFDRNMRVLQALSERVIIGSRTCPEEYRLWPEYVGSPPRPEFYGKFADFAVSLCEKYRPWAFEVWNEPDCPRRYAYDQRYFGSWVDNSDPFLAAGKSYGEFCREVYDRIHATGTVVIAGALLGAPSSLEFAQGFMDGGGKCDAFTFHKYINVEKGEKFEDAFEFATALAGVVPYPLAMNETSVIGTKGLAHEKTKAEYCAYLKSMYVWSDLLFVEWYSLNSQWEETQLIKDGLATPAYEVWKD